MDVAAVFRTHAEELFRYLARECGDPDAAQDAVQEAFMRLQTRPPSDESAVRPWLFRTGLNVLRDEHRVRANRARLLESNPHAVPRPETAPGPDGDVEKREDLARLRHALDGLRDRERTALLMRESGFTHREIAESVGTTTGTVGTLIARAMRKLEGAMGKEEGE